MEQVQPTVVMEPAKKKPVGLQIAALIIGIVGFAVSSILAACTLWGITWTAAIGDSPFRIAEPLSTVLTVLAVLFGIVAIVLGIVGLILSCRKPRRPLGIVLSAIGLLLGFSGLFYLLRRVFWAAWLPIFYRNFPM